MEIVGITQGKNVPSTRFRWSQYLKSLRDFGFNTSELTSTFGAYPPQSKFYRSAWLAATTIESLTRSLRSNSYDLIFLQRNLIATLYTWEALIKKPFIFDVDDAIFLGPRGNNAFHIARRASTIICGNNFLAENFSKYGDVKILPTAVDSERFSPLENFSSARPIIGWSGSSSGLKYLYNIESAIFKLLLKHKDLIIKVISDKPPAFKKIPSDRVIYEPWSADREVKALQEFTIGIMPLDDDLWARGKCSFKMLTYMAVGIPVVVSPVGMNAEILAQGSCGFGPSNSDEWVDAISCLLSNSSLAKEMGRTGRKLIEHNYAKKIIAPRLAEILKENIK